VSCLKAIIRARDNPSESCGVMRARISKEGPTPLSIPPSQDDEQNDSKLAAALKPSPTGTRSDFANLLGVRPATKHSGISENWRKPGDVSEES